jgi:transposase InsO family protein
VHLAGCTPTPGAPWVTQHARQLTWTFAERCEHVRFLIRDRDQKFTHEFDEVFRGDGIAIVRTPFRAPQANGVAERFVRTARSECLDWMLILNQPHLARVLGAPVAQIRKMSLIFLDKHNPQVQLGILKSLPRRLSLIGDLPVGGELLSSSAFLDCAIL